MSTSTMLILMVIAAVVAIPIDLWAARRRALDGQPSAVSMLVGLVRDRTALLCGLGVAVLFGIWASVGGDPAYGIVSAVALGLLVGGCVYQLRARNS